MYENNFFVAKHAGATVFKSLHILHFGVFFVITLYKTHLHSITTPRCQREVDFVDEQEINFAIC